MQKLKLNLNEFRSFIVNKKCICFGAGLQGIRFIKILDNWKKKEDILGFIDNDPIKWGKRLVCDELSYPIMSIEESLNCFQENVILVISCADFISIGLQLEQYDRLDKVHCISLVEIGQRELMVSDYRQIIHDYTMPVIPKKIHYCWFGGEMPKFLKNNVEQWKRLCPDYEIIEWNELNYDVNKNRYAKQAYDMKKWGYVSDYVRLDIIHEYGGIYLDTDIEMLCRPDELLYQEGFACFDSSLLVNTGSGFGARAHENIIGELRDYYNNIEFAYLNGNYNRVSCMIHSYNVLKKYGIVIDDKIQRIENINIYPMIFQGTCSFTRQMRITNKTFFLHYGTITWLDKKNKEKRNELGKIYSKNNNDDLISYNLEML